MTDRMAPSGKLWLCMMCGKTAKDSYGEERGWDESCALNCLLVDEATKRPTDQQAHEFHEERDRYLREFPKRMEEWRKQLRDGTLETDPELLELARQIVRDKALPEPPKEPQP